MPDYLGYLLTGPGGGPLLVGPGLGPLWLAGAPGFAGPTEGPPEGIADAVAAAIDAALGASFPGGVLCDEHPFDATLPRVAVVDLGGSTSFDTSGLVDDGEVAVTVFAPGRAEARSLGLALRSALVDADAPLSPAAGLVLYLRPVTPPVVTLDPAKGPGGEDVWRADLTLRALIESD